MGQQRLQPTRFSRGTSTARGLVPVRLLYALSFLEQPHPERLQGRAGRALKGF